MSTTAAELPCLPYAVGGVASLSSLRRSGSAPEADRHDQFQMQCGALRTDLYRYAYWLSRDRAVADDVVQSTMLRAWTAWGSLRDHTSVKAWLLTIARREHARLFERKRLVTVPLESIEELVENAPSQEEDHDVDAVRHALRYLPDSLREPLVLQALMGYSIAEVALSMKLSTTAVLSRLFRARKQLRALCESQ